MKIFILTFWGLMAAPLAYFGWALYSDYRKATGSTWSRLVSAAQDSATVLWAKFCAGLAIVIANLDSIANALGDPSAATFVNTWLSNPKAVAAVMLGISIVTIVARKRTL